MRFSVYLFIAILAPVIGFSQTTEDFIKRRFTFNTGISMFGNGSLASVDIESAVKVKKEMHLCLKTGLGQNIIEHECQPFCTHTRQYDMATIPINLISLIYVARKKQGQAFIEIGLGSTLAILNGQVNYLLYPIIGYRVYPFRYLPVHYRVYTHLPYLHHNKANFNGYYTPFGLSLGYSL